MFDFERQDPNPVGETHIGKDSFWKMDGDERREERGEERGERRGERREGYIPLQVLKWERECVFLMVRGALSSLYDSHPLQGQKR